MKHIFFLLIIANYWGNFQLKFPANKFAHIHYKQATHQDGPKPHYFINYKQKMSTRKRSTEILEKSSKFINKYSTK